MIGVFFWFLFLPLLVLFFLSLPFHVSREQRSGRKGDEDSGVLRLAREGAIICVATTPTITTTTTTAAAAAACYLAYVAAQKASILLLYNRRAFENHVVSHNTTCHNQSLSQTNNHKRETAWRGRITTVTTAATSRRIRYHNI